MEFSFNPLDVDPEELNRQCQIDRFCRLCLCEAPQLVPLRSIVGSVAVPKMFTAVTGVQIDFDDPYPKKLCTVCLDKLETAYGIRKEFLDNFATLQSYFDGMVKSTPGEDEIVIKEELLDDLDLNEPELEQELTVPDVAIGMAEAEMSIEDENSSENANHAPEYVDVPVGVSPEPCTSGKVKRPRRNLQIVGERSEINPGKCYICSATFDGPRELNAHLPQHADMLPYTCEPCATGGGFQKKKIITIVLLHRHIQMHAGTIECPHCPIRVYNETRLYAHIKRHHAKHSRGKFTCEKCGFQLHSKEGYQSHMVRHDAVEEGRYTCAVCDKKFGTSTRLKRHLLTHDDSKQYQCQFCSKSITSKTLLLQHEREHADNTKQYACAFCEARFTNRSTQALHTSTNHPETIARRKPVEDGDDRSISRRINKACKYEGCDYVAKSYASYHNHKNRHEARFACSVCQKPFPSRQQLQMHENIHLPSSERPFACDQCDKRFNNQARLTDHMREHTDVRPYLCNLCGESFHTSARLNNHVLKHSAPQHKCHHCGKDFRYKGDYVRHIRKHEEENAAREGHSADF